MEDISSDVSSFLSQLPWLSRPSASFEGVIWGVESPTESADEQKLRTFFEVIILGFD